MNENSKRIAKNTPVFYVRMLAMMVISIYTSRVILKSLGIEDYGIYNVVGGFVSMFTMISGSLNNAINRFLMFDIGKGNIEQLTKTFSSAVTIKWDKAMQQIADKYTSDTEYIFPIITMGRPDKGKERAGMESADHKLRGTRAHHGKS